MKDNLSFFEKIKQEGVLAVLGVPLDLGKDSVGTDKGPKAIREQGILSAMTDVGFEVKDLGDIACPDRVSAKVGEVNVKYLEAIVQVAEDTSKAVEKELKSGNKVLVIGGDNTISLGSLAGAAAALGEVGVIWIDAHGDINTDATTVSGNVHGMPISAALGLGNKNLVNINFKGQKVKSENLVYVGLKDLDQAEIDIIREQKIEYSTMLDIAANGLAPAFDKIFKLAKKVKYVWVCLDVDSMDEEIAPGTPMATSGGLNFRESLNLAKYIGKVCNVVGVDVSELAPDLDKGNKTSRLIVELVANYFGGEYSWYTKYMLEEQKKLASKAVDRMN